MRVAVARVRLGAMPLQWIVFAALSIVFAIFAAVTTYWPAIVAQPPSAAAFLGALAGAGGGLLAIILGALLNAELNRRRDDRLRREETEALIKSLASEMEAIAINARTNAAGLRRMDRGHLASAFRMLLPPKAPVFEANAGKIGWIPDAPRGHIFAAIIEKEKMTAAIHAIIAAGGDEEIPGDFCTGLAAGFEGLAGIADTTVKILKEARVP